MWCHNPEGFLPAPQTMRSHQGCTLCGNCERPCTHPECIDLDYCIKICAKGLISVAGEEVESFDLAKRLRHYSPVFKNLGGVTITGGEPLMQPRFLLELLHELKDINTLLQTSGYGDSDAFSQAVDMVDHVFFDIKLTDPEKHRKYTGVDNYLILNNLEALKSSGKSFVVRLPIIPGVNDTAEHFTKVAELLKDAGEKVSVEILPYNRLAGGKYASVGMDFHPEYDEDAPLTFFPEIFDKMGIDNRIL